MEAKENVDVTAVMLFSVLWKVTLIEPSNYSKIIV
jgi:hypothetical protein